MSQPIPIVDLFSGPGGLGEGFASLKDELGEPCFRIAVSIEKEPSAHGTLRLRAFLRKFKDWPQEYYDWIAGEGIEPIWQTLYPVEWEAADDEARCMELGESETTDFLAGRIDAIRTESGGKTVLIGGPPCQAYSIVGRSRNAGIADYDPAEDRRNYLYDEYVKVLHRLKPAVFVMENVKGMLSAAVKGDAIFHAVLRDLGAEGYKLVALAPKSDIDLDLAPGPRDFIVRSEDYGIPQARHRVIIVGIRNDIADGLPYEELPRLKATDRSTTVGEALAGMPGLRSGLSHGDSIDAWIDAVSSAARQIEVAISKSVSASGWTPRFFEELQAVRQTLKQRAHINRIGHVLQNDSHRIPSGLREWLLDDRLVALPQNETRGHMASDLARYLFASIWGVAHGVSPKASDFPRELSPNHANWRSGKFDDRFRVQLSDRPASTVTSHIAKDGHYYIHPDPSQCRSLTVREAARLQTFPDNYVFLGNRTQQFVQVGNAVPPLLARKIAEAVLPVLKNATSRSDCELVSQ